MNEIYKKEYMTCRTLFWYKVQVTSSAVCLKKCSNILKYTRH